MKLVLFTSSVAVGIITRREYKVKAVEEIILEGELKKQQHTQNKKKKDLTQVTEHLPQM